MKKIKNKKQFVVGIIAAVVAVACLIVGVIKAGEMRFLISAFLSGIYAVISFYSAFSKKGILEDIEKTSDERDIYLAMKTSKVTIQILSYILFGLCLLGLILYGAFHSVIFMTIAAISSAILIVAFIIMLCVNGYYERRG